ncbi:Integrase catalytic core [Penicillium verhagenii]|nr:Integrase catalytic core [Penicillium verhagenii]
MYGCSTQNPRRVSRFKGMWTALHVKLWFTTAYHAQADGQSERSNQTAEIWMRHWVSTHPTEGWDQAIPPMIASLNSSINASTGDTPHKLMFGINLRAPWDLLRNVFSADIDRSVRADAHECAKYAAMEMKKRYDAHHKVIHFAVGDFVYLRLQEGIFAFGIKLIVVINVLPYCTWYFGAFFARA